MKNIFLIAIKDVKLKYKEKKVIFISLVLPIILTIILGNTFGNTDANKIKIGIIDRSGSGLSKSIFKSLKEIPVLEVNELNDSDIEKSINDLKNGEGEPFLILTKDLDKINSNKEIIFYADKGKPILNHTIDSILRTIINEYNLNLITVNTILNVSKKYNKYVGQDKAKELADKIILNDDTLIEVNKKYIGDKNTNSNSIVFATVLAGMGLMFILFSAILGGSLDILEERNKNIFYRLSTIPLSRISIIAGKILGILLALIIQALIFYLVGWLFFEISVNDLFASVILTLSFLFVATSLAIMISSFIKKINEVEAIGVPLILFLSAIGGCWFPLELMPDWLRKISFLLPTGWATDAFSKLFTYQAVLSDIIVNIIILILYGIVFLSIGIYKFKIINSNS